MDVGFFVAGDAGLGCAFEGLVDVAGFAGGGGVFAEEGEDAVVVKVGHLSIAGMATEAVGTELGDVVGHEVGGIGLVAVDTVNAGVSVT